MDDVPAEPSGPPPRRPLDLDSLVRLFRRQWRPLAGFVTAVLAAAGVATALTPRTYRAVAVVQLMPRAGQEVEVKEVVRNDEGGYMETRDRARTHMQLMTSVSLRSAVLEAWAAEGHTDLAPDQAGVEALGRMLSVGPREDTQLVEIAITHRDPETAAALANLVANVYCSTNLYARTDAARDAKGWLGGEKATARTDLDAAQAKLQEFKKANDLVDAEERVNAVTAQLETLQKALGEATASRALTESNLRQHRRLLEAREFEVLAAQLSDPALDSLVKDRARILTETSAVLATYGDQHPEHQRAVEKIARADALVASQVQSLVDAEGAKVTALRNQEATIQSELERVKTELLEKERVSAEYARLKADEERARKLDEVLSQRSTEVDLQANSRLNDVRVVDEATPPSSPSKPNVPVNLAVALALGLGGGLGLVLLRNRFDDTLHEVADVEWSLQTRLLGTLPRMELPTREERAFYPFDHPRSRAAEAIRSARVLLSPGGAQGGTRTLLVTSSVADEGKTHASVHLAVAFAQKHQKVLLIDADGRLPQLHGLFGASDEVGFYQALTGHHLDEVVVHTRIPDLDLMPAGPAPEDTDAVLTVPALQGLLDEVREHYDVIIFDTPPAAVLSDALALAPMVDGVVLVVRPGRVKRATAWETLQRLSLLGARVKGVLVNDVVGAVPASKYYDDDRARRAPPRA